MTIVLAVIAVIIAWISIDLYIGFKLHRSKIRPMEESVLRKSHVDFFPRGDKLFDHMLDKIDKAEHHIHIQFFIFRDDHIGRKFLELLKEKAVQGVDVRLMVDWGGYAISKKEKKSLKKAGVLIKKTNVPSFPLLFYSMNVRNHRKVTVIDGFHGYIGGYNVGDEYLGRDPDLGRWRDYHIYVGGEAVQDFQKQFITDWNGASGEKTGENKIESKPAGSGPVPLKVIPTDGAHVIEMVDSLLDRAKESVIIGTPYFIPGKILKNKLIRLAKNGINVKLIIPKYADHPFVKDAAFPYFPDLLKAGVTIRQFTEGFYHSKVIVIDDYLMDIGTSNFDKRSFHLNKEINCIIEDRDWVLPVKKEIEKDFYECSEEITLKYVRNRSVFERGKEMIGTALSPFM
ncbi:cardiolipin synthase [Salipaludibacillus aurantiacus]|nr:cardiolipin synthase [Salipaludibacillus aurantiacus]